MPKKRYTPEEILHICGRSSWKLSKDWRYLTPVEALPFHSFPVCQVLIRC